MSVPYRFSWFVEGKIAGMAWPDSETMEYLSQQGIKVLVNLTGEPTVYGQTAKDYGIECLTISIADFCPPTVLQVKEFIELVDKTVASGGAIGVHCAMGCGRTGTMLACYLVANEGYNADDAIVETRKRRKNSIETRRQEQSVRDYEKSLKGEN